MKINPVVLLNAVFMLTYFFLLTMLNMYNVHNIKSLYTFEIYISYFKCKPTFTAIMTDTADN